MALWVLARIRRALGRRLSFWLLQEELTDEMDKFGSEGL